MSTTATIAAYDPTLGRVTQVFLRNDGYLDHAGKILLNYYNTNERVAELLNHRHIVNLAPNIDYVAPSKEGFYRRASCEFYMRDRPDEAQMVDPHLYDGVDDYRKRGVRQDYNYFWDGKQWLVNYGDYFGTVETELLLIKNERPSEFD